MGAREKILEIAGSTDRYNFHTHTQFCDGRAPMEEMAAGAELAGLKYLGFSPHSPLPIPSGCNMTPESVPLYLREIERLKATYRGRMEIFAGMEIDFIGGLSGPSDEYFRTLPLDYRIGSVHFIPNQRGEFIDIDGRPENFIKKMDQFFDRDIRYVVETFYRSTNEMIEKGGFDIVGHFDKIGLNASKYAPGVDEEPWYDSLVRQTVDAIAEKGLVAEINTKHYALHNRTFPHLRYIGLLREKGVAMIVNSDAHYPELTDASRDVALQALKA